MSESVMETDKYGTKSWRNSRGKLHRTDGPAVEWLNGDKEWWVEGKRHRADGPAVECLDGYKAWWVRGKRHRTDGPAVEQVDGHKEWWVEGKCLGDDDEGFWALWERLSDEDRASPTLLSYLPEKF
jgi:hypothetical protein